MRLFISWKLNIGDLYNFLIYNPLASVNYSFNQWKKNKKKKKPHQITEQTEKLSKLFYVVLLCRDFKFSKVTREKYVSISSSHKKGLLLDVYCNIASNDSV